MQNYKYQFTTAHGGVVTISLPSMVTNQDIVHVEHFWGMIVHQLRNRAVLDNVGHPGSDFDDSCRSNSDVS